jgi:phage baseplate assembly protein gpV
LNDFKDIVKIGIVNAVYPDIGKVKVSFPDKDNRMSRELPMLNFEYDMPEIKDQVICIFLPNGTEAGFCLGSFHSKVDPPPTTNGDLHWKVLGNESFFNIDKKTGLANLKLKKLVIDGDVEINGSLKISGNLTVNSNARVDNSLNVGAKISTSKLNATDISATKITASTISAGSISEG